MPRAQRSDARYSTARWQKLRALVIARGGGRCWVNGCQLPGNVADHIEPVYRGMPDSEFFDIGNLRCSCRPHNLARGHAAREGGDISVTGAGVSSPLHAVGRRSITVGPFLRDVPAARLRLDPSTHTSSRQPRLTGDYSRRRAGDGAA